MPSLFFFPRCGIVLCSRDAKFAVECDTCRMSYCLVCLASGTKDPCVRCGQRPSKRVEQLVHLRLKSIYKAFKQSGATLAGGGGGGGIGAGGAGGGDGGGGKGALPPASSDGKMAAALHAATGVPVKTTDGKVFDGPDDITGDVGAVLQAAAAAAAGVGVVAGGRERYDPFGGGRSYGDGGRGGKGSAKASESDKFAAKTSEEADAAAAALLAELDREDGKAAAKSGKKSKKKKKKEKELAAAAASAAAAAADDDDDDASAGADPAEEGGEGPQSKGKKKKKKKKKKGKGSDSTADREPSPIEDAAASSDEDDLMMLVGGPAPGTAAPKQGAKGKMGAAASEGTSAASTGPRTPSDASPQLAQARSSRSSTDAENVDVALLTEFVQSRDIAAIEAFMESLKGVPGKASIRKNAKKALKKLKEEGAGYSAARPVSYAAPPRRPKSEETWEEVEKTSSKAKPKSQKELVLADTRESTFNYDTAEQDWGGYRPEPLLKLISQTHRSGKDESGKSGDYSSARTETVLHMSPLVVGWVIGRGGTRIRDLMDESGAKIWIDQDSMGPREPRIVYVSGPRKSVDGAVRMVKDLVSKAPVGGGTSQPVTPSPVKSSPPPSKPAPAGSTDSSATPASFAAAASNVAPPSYAAASAAGPKSKPAQDSHPLNIDPAPMTKKGDVYRQLLRCEPRFVPLLIGRRGWTVKHIQDATAARVDIDQTVSPRKIVVSSKDERAVRSAVRMVQDVLNYPNAQEKDEESIDGNYADISTNTSNNADAPAGYYTLGTEKAHVVAQPSTVPSGHFQQQLGAAGHSARQSLSQPPFASDTVPAGSGMFGRNGLPANGHAPAGQHHLPASSIPLFAQGQGQGLSGGLFALQQDQQQRQYQSTSTAGPSLQSLHQNMAQMRLQEMQPKPLAQDSIRGAPPPPGLSSSSALGGFIEDASSNRSGGGSFPKSSAAPALGGIPLGSGNGLGSSAGSGLGGLGGLSNSDELYGRSGSSLLSGHSLPFQQQQQSLVGASLGLGGVGPSLDSPNTRPVTAERDIIDDIFGSMPPANSGGGGGATDWGSSGLSGWATGGFGGDASREGSGGLAGDLSSMLQQPMNGGGLGLCGDFLDEQEGEKRQQQQPWNT